jgi:hypothetical protein
MAEGLEGMFESYDGGKQEHGHADSQEGHGVSCDECVKEHGPAHMVSYHHDHENNQHTVNSMHADGHNHQSVHSSAAEAYEAGGKLSATDVKRREHPDQQGAESEEKNYEMPDLA